MYSSCGCVELVSVRSVLIAATVNATYFSTFLTASFQEAPANLLTEAGHTGEGGV